MEADTKPRLDVQRSSAILARFEVASIHQPLTLVPVSLALKNETALVTGASSGIGREFARLLARRGIDLVITSRRVERLEQLRDELQAAHGVRVTVLVEDLSVQEAPERIVTALAALDRPVSILINNAGFGYYGSVVLAEPADIQDTIQVNVAALTMLTRHLAAGMRERRHGYILNVSSFAALQPIPAYTVYSGAKAYVVAFSQGLRHELRKSGVKVSCICPGFTETEFHDVARHRKTSWMRLVTLDPYHVARSGIDGMFKGKALIIPGIVYKLNAFVLRFLPRTAASAVSAAIVKS